MPAPERTTRTAIIEAGRELLEQQGVGALTMQAVAARVGVRAPSLYKRIRDRDELVVEVVSATLAEVTARIDAVAAGVGDPRARMRALADELRRFGHAHPVAYSMIFGATTGPARPALQQLERSVAPVLDAVSELVDDDSALHAARTLTAWANGFILMELAGAFRLGGDVDAAWAWGLEHVVAGIGTE